MQLNKFYVKLIIRYHHKSQNVIWKDDYKLCTPVFTLDNLTVVYDFTTDSLDLEFINAVKIPI